MSSRTNQKQTGALDVVGHVAVLGVAKTFCIDTTPRA
jgi:hypothetical protein